MKSFIRLYCEGFEGSRVAWRYPMQFRTERPWILFTSMTSGAE